jgi:hypothetical protein
MLPLLYQIMKAAFKNISAFLFGCMLMHTLTGQTASPAVIFNKKIDQCAPPLGRALFHDWVNAQQKNILKLDGKDDQQFTPSANEDVNFILTQNATIRIDDLQCQIENDSTLNDQKKKGYLKAIENLLKSYLSHSRSKKISRLKLPDIITVFERSYQADLQGQSILPIIKEYPYETILTVLNADNITFVKNEGYADSRQLLIYKYCLQYPTRTLKTLFENPGLPFADTLIKLVAKNNPKELYDYAQSTNSTLANTIRGITDDNFVKTIAEIAQSKSGMQYFPFLDNILNGKITIQALDEAKEDSLLYYRLLVKTQIDYTARLHENDTAFEYKTLTERLEKKAKEGFVTTINGLHSENAEVRFKSIQPLTAEELYYLAVSSDGSIYTSSFVKGVFPLMMRKINNRGDSLLMAVHFDKYRKLIKMCAGYNTLGDFLATFPKAANPADEEPSNTLMRAFVKNLEKSAGPEDAVDVADSYASIAETLKPLADQMLFNVQENLLANQATNNKNGIALYTILEKLFLSADTTKHIDLTKELGIPPVYEVPYASLTNDSGRVIMQQFFYGDKDGMGVFNGFIKQFTNANWKIVAKPKWVEVSSLKGKPVTIYANRALPEEGGEDELAQKELCAYLETNKLFPTVTIHRGHSYYANATIEQMAPSSKIVFLGSCGGYHLLHSVLDVAEDAHITASKQIGATEINRPFIQLLADKARLGSNIDWIPFWKELEKSVGNVPEFVDYIPPYKNLGALFIKAYKIAMSKDSYDDDEE